MTDELARLFEHETDDAIPAEHEQQIRAGLGALLAGSAATNGGSTEASTTPATTSAAGTATGAAVKLTTAVLVGIGMAAGGFAIGRATAPTPVTPSAPATATATAVAPATATATTTTIATATPPPTATTTTVATATPTATPSSTTFDREQSLLERARSALVRHDVNAAQEALDVAERDFPRSRHAEERDYLRIQVLRERGDADQARERARTFLAKYPDSLLRARVEAVAR